MFVCLLFVCISLTDESIRFSFTFKFQPLIGLVKDFGGGYPKPPIRSRPLNKITPEQFFFLMIIKHFIESRLLPPPPFPLEATRK